MSSNVEPKIKRPLYIPPHARKTKAKNDNQPETNTKKVRLCDDSSLMFGAAEKTEERYFRFYIDEQKNKEFLKQLELQDKAKPEFIECSKKPEVEEKKVRPKTCTASAKRLVSNALGIKPTFSSAEKDTLIKMLEGRGSKKNKIDKEMTNKS